ncbi:MAG TPA: FixH family protein [Pyrinomonadaceae bacterium]|nr:FixH family protein [Pyrinomonadaceae bacterium]
MPTNLLSLKTTAGRRRTLLVGLMSTAVMFAACGRSPAPEAEHEEEAIARTEFTDRIENFFEYDALKAGKQSQFLIHLTDLSDGTPVENADVTLITRTKSGSEVMQTKARIGKVTGIYVADVTIPSAGDYDIEFFVKNAKINERIPLTDFKVE